MAKQKVVALAPEPEPEPAPALTLPKVYTLNSGRGSVKLVALGYYVTFADGTYSTSDIDEIEALDELADAGVVTRL